MKKIYFIILVVLLTNATKSQNYHPMVNENKFWAELNYSWGFLTTSYYKLSGDTVINNKTYKLVYSCFQDSLMQNWNKWYYCIREDSLKRVYKYDFVNENLIYDFTLNKGDSINTRAFMGGQAIYAQVDSVDLVMINGEYRKRIIFENMGWLPEIWIEGIGSNTSVFQPFYYMYIADLSLELLCVKENNVLIYQNQNYNSCYISNTGIDESNKPDNNIIIKPNPVLNSSIIYITGEIIQNQEYKIINSNGTIVRNGKFFGNTFNFDKGNLAAGLYLIIVKNNEKTMYKKLIIN